MALGYPFFADQYNDEQVVSTTNAAGTIGKIGFDFGLRATSVTVWNDKASDVYVSLSSTVGSTGGFRLKANENITLQVLIGGMSLASTTTSTGDVCRVLAVRG